MPPDPSVAVEREEEDVIFGIDSHKSSLAVCEIDQLGRRACSASFANSRRGHEELLCWTREQAPDERLFGVEGAGKYAYALTRLLLAAAESVMEIPAQRDEAHSRSTSLFGTATPTPPRP